MELSSWWKKWRRAERLHRFDFTNYFELLPSNKLEPRCGPKRTDESLA